jgi:hypothetical protein
MSHDKSTRFNIKIAKLNARNERKASSVSARNAYSVAEAAAASAKDAEAAFIKKMNKGAYRQARKRKLRRDSNFENKIKTRMEVMCLD